MPPSLCPVCSHVRIVKGRHDQTYLLCRNPSIPDKYPRQPVTTCPGYRSRPGAVIAPPELQAILNAHAFLHVERPPALWAFDAETETFIRLLGEMIASALVRNGGVLAEVTLNVANVTIEPSEDSSVPPGDFVAISLGGAGDWLPETTWAEGGRGRAFVNADLERAAGHAGARYGYTRQVALDRGSVTVFFRRVEI